MKLQRLELFGFKSFADRVTIEFNPGVTAIVGPNGCGKSNISDAIRWVLGEQRPTLVRGSKMEEVIFNGTRDRKPINLAEVALHFSNEDGLLPVEYSEVAIARRVFRDGESDYLLNKHVCRLKDIQDLLMGTGVGTHSYSLIQQGMVDSLLSDRAEERRTIFEEAAGVTRYKNRRRSAERKLEATNADLDRVEDIVAEVERNVASLKRQVSKARRFQRYQAEETRLDVHLAATALQDLGEREGPLREQMKALQATESELAARLGEREAGVETLELELIEVRQDDHTARAEADAVRARITRREESRLVNGETLKHHRRRLEELIAEAEQARMRADDLAERRANLEVDLAAARDEVEHFTAPDHGSSAQDDEARYAELKSEQHRLVERIESLRERLTEIDTARARQVSAEEVAATRLEALVADLDAGRRELQAAETAAEEARSTVRGAEERRSASESERDAARGSARALRERAEEIRDRLGEARAAEQAAVGRREALADLESRFEGYASGARALLGGARRAGGVHGALPQMIEPSESRYEKALERYLESLGHGLLVRDRRAARDAAAHLAEQNAGRADFLIPELTAHGGPPAIPDRAASYVIARGPAAVRWTGDRDVATTFAALFDRMLIVADADACFACRDALATVPDAARYYAIVGLDGSLLEPIGRWRTAGGNGGSGLLSRRRRLAEADAEVAELTRAVAALADDWSAVETELEEAASREAQAAGAWARADAEYRAGREALVAAEQAVRHADRRRGELETEIGELSAIRERAEQSKVAIVDTRDELTGDIDRATTRLTEVRAAIERFEASRTERLSEKHAVELEQTTAEANLRAIEREIEHLASAEAMLEEDRAGRAAERTRLEEESARLEKEIAATTGEIETLCDELDAIEKTTSEFGRRLAAMEERRAGHDADLKRFRREHDAAVQERHRCELALQDIGHRRETTESHLRETYDAPLARLVDAHPLAEEEQSLERDELRERLDAVRRKRVNLGPVNMLAVEEYDRESERLAFLVEQRDDLLTSRGRLEEAIRKIDRTARELFVETFARIKDGFNATFQTLFEGGFADIALADESDPLEAPIEIVASPRGKRIQSINLLSGGERALTALALLFAIYRVKPSPFCILDEVDAPLDDANVSRFLNMIRHFTDDTQFVIITHNKRTMEAADFLYGVTMEEPGISSLVSVALDAPVEPESRAVEEMPAEEALLAAG